MRIVCFCLLWSFPFQVLKCQQDSIAAKLLNEVIITATRNETKLANVAVPVQLIQARTLVQSGSIRLTDILPEQTGLFITNANSSVSAGGGIFGNGVEVQGLAPDYIMIMVDGEPLTGRQGGVIDLSRITVNDIKRIEIIKGPSSSLYGSEALGGVINIITRQAENNSFFASLRYGRFDALDASLTASVKKDKWGLLIGANRNSFSGYSLVQNASGKTVDPFQNYTGQIKFISQVSPKTRFMLTGRYFFQKQQNFFTTADSTGLQTVNIEGHATIDDYSINPVFTQYFSPRVSSSMRLYYSRYRFRQDLFKQTDRSQFYYDFFQQDFYRAENQTVIALGKKQRITAGGGINPQTLNTTRYKGIKRTSQIYFFLQDEWKPLPRILTAAGIRYDHNDRYAAVWSPKFSLNYTHNSHLIINASYGAGFKAPDFRQLFLNFTNNAAGGYTIYGANEISYSELQVQLQQGILAQILPIAQAITILKPETSSGINLGLHYLANDKLSFRMNLFRNDIKNLIDYQIIAYKPNNVPVFSYFNINRAFTEGMELGVDYAVTNAFQIQWGYQFLITADKNILDRIRRGELYGRNLQTNQVELITRKEYGGLPNRSKHQGNLKIFYTDNKKKWDASIRLIYRSRWGTADKDGNGIINRADEFAAGFLTCNLSGTRKLGDFTAGAGINNLLNYRDVNNLPGQPGIQPYISISYSFIQNKKHKT